jgi:hypothetical protein
VAIFAILTEVVGVAGVTQTIPARTTSRIRNGRNRVWAGAVFSQGRADDRHKKIHLLLGTFRLARRILIYDEWGEYVIKIIF